MRTYVRANPHRPCTRLPPPRPFPLHVPAVKALQPPPSFYPQRLLDAFPELVPSFFMLQEISRRKTSVIFISTSSWHDMHGVTGSGWKQGERAVG